MNCLGKGVGKGGQFKLGNKFVFSKRGESLLSSTPFVMHVPFIMSNLPGMGMALISEVQCGKLT